MLSEPYPVEWPPHLCGQFRLMHYEHNHSPLPEFEDFKNDDQIYNELNWRFLKQGKISQQQFGIDTISSYERSVTYSQSLFGIFKINETLSIIRTADTGTIILSKNWDGKFKNNKDVEMNLYQYKKWFLFKEAKVFSNAYISGTRSVTRGSIEHVLGRERPGETEEWYCKGEFEVMWNSKELILVKGTERARNGAKNKGFGEEAILSIV